MGIQATEVAEVTKLIRWYGARNRDRNNTLDVFVLVLYSRAFWYCIPMHVGTIFMFRC